MKDLIIKGVHLEKLKFNELNSFIDELDKNCDTGSLFTIFKHLTYLNTITENEKNKILGKITYYMGW